MLPAVANRASSVVSLGLKSAPEAVARWFQMGNAEIGHLQADKCIGRVFALRDELIDDLFSVSNELLGARKIAIVSGMPVVIGRETIQNAAGRPLGLGQFLVERREFRIDNHLQFGTLL